MIDTQDIRLLVAIRHFGTLVGAARSLNVTPSAVTQRLQHLEKRLDMHLVERTARKLRFTDEGLFLCDRGEALLEQHEALWEHVAQRHGKLIGTLKINAPFGFGRKYVATVVAEFAALHPHVKVLLKLSEQPLFAEKDRFDLVLHIGEMQNSSLIVHKIAPNSRYVCAAPSLLEHHGLPALPQDLSRYPCIALQENNEDTTLWMFRKGSHRQAVRMQPTLSSNDGAIACLWAKAGRGVIMRSQWDVAEAVKQGELVRLLPEWTLPEAPVVALMPRRKGVAERVKVFLAMLKQRFAPVPPWQTTKS